jgi:hypothetical protein
VNRPAFNTFLTAIAAARVTVRARREGSAKERARTLGPINPS